MGASFGSGAAGVFLLSCLTALASGLRAQPPGTLAGVYVATAGQYLQFFPDGIFIDHRVTDQLIVPSRFYEHPRIQRGTYEIERQTILFSFADGHRGMRTFLAPAAQANSLTFDWIDLGWQMFFEEGYRTRLSGGL